MKQTSTDKAVHGSEPGDTGPQTATLDATAEATQTVSTARPVLGEAIVRVSPTLRDATDRYRLARPVLEI